MRVEWPKDIRPRYRVCHPVNTGGTTWLRESDLVFVKGTPYAVLSWSHGNDRDVPAIYAKLKPRLLKHDRPDSQAYRYQGEITEPTASRPRA